MFLYLSNVPIFVWFKNSCPSVKGNAENYYIDQQTSTGLNSNVFLKYLALPTENP